MQWNELSLDWAISRRRDHANVEGPLTRPGIKLRGRVVGVPCAPRADTRSTRFRRPDRSRTRPVPCSVSTPRHTRSSNPESKHSLVTSSIVILDDDRRGRFKHGPVQRQVLAGLASTALVDLDSVQKPPRYVPHFAEAATASAQRSPAIAHFSTFQVFPRLRLIDESST